MAMLALNGIKLPHLKFSLQKMGDFLFHEAPIQSHFISEKNEDYLFHWADADEQYNRWLVVKTTPELLHVFFSGDINNVDLIKNNPDGFVYFIDADANFEWQHIFLVANKDIPFNYFPSHDSWFIPKHYELYALELKAFLEHYFSRREKIYKITEPEVDLVYEPAHPYKITTAK